MMSSLPSAADPPPYFTHLSLAGIFRRTLEVLLRWDRYKVFMEIMAFVMLLLLLIITAGVFLESQDVNNVAFAKCLNLFLTVNVDLES